MHKGVEIMTQSRFQFSTYLIWLLRPFQKDCIAAKQGSAEGGASSHGNASSVPATLHFSGSTSWPERYLIFWSFGQIPRILIQISHVRMDRWQIQGSDGQSSLKMLQNSLKMLQSLSPPVDGLDWWEEKANDTSPRLVGFYTLQSFVKTKSIFRSLDVSWWHHRVRARVQHWTDPQ